MLIQGQVGPQTANTSLSAGTTPTVRLGQLGDVVVSELHGRFYEQAYRGNLFSGGIASLTSISNATFTTSTLSATGTPIVGLWNPITSSVNCVLLQATLAITITATTATGAGPFTWAVSTQNSAISTGNLPLNRKTLVQSGSQVRDMSGVALTGITNNPVARFGSSLGGGQYTNASFVATAVASPTILQGFTENFDGSIIIPPGGFIGLFATATPVAHSATSQLLWEEVPI